MNAMMTKSWERKTAGKMEEKAEGSGGPLIIRRAHLSDVEQMIELLQMLFALEPDFSFNAVKQRKGLVQLICRDQGACVLVAEAPQGLAGMCTVQTVVSTAEGGPVGWVEDMVVHPNYRKQGVGRKLLMTLEQWATTEGLLRLQLLADQENNEALGFYAKQGWRTTRMKALKKMIG